MKTTLLTLAALMVLSQNTLANTKVWTFTYKVSQKESFEIKKPAESKDQAYKLAAKECFQKLTQGTYPGESKGLEIIDVCANPKM